MNDFNAKVAALAARIEAETIQRLIDSDLGCEANIAQARTSVKPGKKYTKIDIGNSGKLMVDADGNVYGIKAYGQIHRGHFYGTLDTIDQYHWGEYYPVRKADGVRP